MTVRFLQLLVLEESCRRQHYVRITRGICEELLVHHSKEIRPHKSADHLIVVRSNHRGIRVVNKNGFYRRLIKFIERLAQLTHIHYPGRAPQRTLAHQVRRSIAVSFSENDPLSESCNPPPTSFHEPVMQGSIAIARIA